MKADLLYGIHPVHEAMSAGRRQVYQLYLAAGRTIGRLQSIVSIADSGGIPLQRVSAGDLKAWLGPAAVHQGVAAEVSPYPLTKLTDLLQPQPARHTDLFLLLLDHIQDPQNLGALLRTALCVGVDGVVLPKDNCAKPTPAVSKASAGALEHIRLSQVTNLVQTIKRFKKEGSWIVGLQREARQSIYTGDLRGSIAMVLGGEEKGIRPLVSKNCDFLFSIPQQGPLESLNASAAGAVAMYEAWRQRNLV